MYFRLWKNGRDQDRGGGRHDGHYRRAKDPLQNLLEECRRKLPKLDVSAKDSAEERQKEEAGGKDQQKAQEKIFVITATLFLRTKDLIFQIHSVQ